LLNDQLCSTETAQAGWNPTDRARDIVIRVGGRAYYICQAAINRTSSVIPAESNGFSSMRWQAM